MKIEQIMSKPAITVTPEDTLNRAAELMWNHDCGALPVVGEAGQLIGMITDRDICMGAYVRGASLGAIPVSTAMARTAFSCRPQDEVAEAAAIMKKHKIRRVAVTDGDNRPVGLLSLNDLARDVCAQTRSVAEREGVLRTFASICEPRARAAGAAAPATAAPR